MIFGKWGFPAWGVAGAGYATALATTLSAAFGFWLMFTREYEAVYRLLSSWRVKWDLMKQFLKYGLPSGLQWALEGLAFTVFLIIMGRLKDGDAALAGSSIAVTVMMLSVLPSMGVAQAVMTMVGQHIGESRPDKAEAVAWTGVKIAALYMMVVALSFALVPGFYLSWFRNEADPALWARVSELTSTLLKIVAMFTVMDSIYLNISFALKGAGDTRFVSAMALLVPWPVMVLPAYLVRGLDRAAVIAWGFGALYSLTISSLLIWRFKGGKWKMMKVV
jgi:multidrug resistance protein, MATE family